MNSSSNQFDDEGEESLPRVDEEEEEEQIIKQLENAQDAEQFLNILLTRNNNPANLINSKHLLNRVIYKSQQYLRDGNREEYEHWKRVCEEILAVDGVNVDVGEYVEEDIECPLSLAIEAKDLSLIELFLEKGADPNALAGFRCRYSMINFAIRAVSVEILMLLLKYGADVNKFSQNFNGLYCPLNYAFFTYDNYEIFDILINLPNISLKKSRLLHTACKEGHVKLVEFLVTNHLSKLDLNHGNSESPLYIACANQHVDIVKLLAPLPGININLGVTKETPLQKAIQVSNIEILRVLIEHGAVFNESDCANAHKKGINLSQIKIEVQHVSKLQQLLKINRLLSDMTFIN